MILPKPIRMGYDWLMSHSKLGRILIEFLARCLIVYNKTFHVKAKQDKTCLIIISHKYKFIYIGLPKIASRSFLTYFVRDKQRFADYEIEWAEKPSALPDALKTYPDYFKFSFVRNPWARVISCYNNKIHNAWIGAQARIMSYYKNLHTKMSFLEFLEWLNDGEGHDEIADRHWLSQHKFLTNDQGVTICDYIGKFETLEQDLQKISARIGIETIKLPHSGFVSKASAYQEYYNENTKKLATQRYQKDIDMFGYDFNKNTDNILTPSKKRQS